ncbi:hypothetical protein TanjilG_01180 [Lupinus angustifolius]|uniref:RING-type domain-containing protein n=1 Tax=Lupinus angustifolius TaxID=3871 RepID=A0A1J7HZ96_LUPAN|nr:PREDICTED: uncharacterized protein LOC109359684 [Lupinus angustifolius]OIW18091.1 hypothetical protein TanjilG_01180 [Lupinus angustifolius]
MASYQVEIPSPSPFGCVLRDHTRFQNNMKNFVRDHINTCNISISSDPAPINKDSQNPIKNGTWASRVVKNNIGSLSFARRSNHNMYNEQDDSSSLSALVSPRHSKTINRWAAKQAREMVSSTLENEGDVLENPSKSDISNLGASSLVQIWEKRLNKFNCTKPNAPLPSLLRTTSPNENALSVEQQQCMVSGQREIIDEPQGNSEVSFQDYESDKSCSPKAHSSSDGAESERGKVADIIKRLTATKKMQSAVSMNDDNDNEVCSNVTGSSHRERNCASTPEQPEYRAFAQVSSNPRIRGRHAFNNLLMQFESEKHGELHNLAERGAVSKFTQRGRIQSLLRLRLLQRGVAANDQCSQKSAASEVNRQPQGSIMHLRERFSCIGVEERNFALVEASNPRSPCRDREIVSNITQLDNIPTENQLGKYTHHRTFDANDEEKAHLSSDVTFQGTCYEAQNDDLKEIIGTSCFVASSSDQHYTTAETNYDEKEEEAESHQQYDASSYNEIEEDEESIDQNYDDTGASYDWISPISRPRSYWEERRQEWYREILHFGADNDERRTLLERRTVSTFLSSDFRERMDSLMMSHAGNQTHLVSSQHAEEDNQESMDQLIMFFQERLHTRSNPQEDGVHGAEEEEERIYEEEVEKAEESITSSSDNELSDYCNQSSSSMHTHSSTTWSYRDNEVDNDCDKASVSSPPPSQSQSFYHDSQQYSSATNHHSIEMEFIYDLRRQMDQLFHEVSELRKSVQSCMDMQMHLQQSQNQEVHTVKEEENKFHCKAPKKGNCCICYEERVNSLFYRCGHMCACLKCANELQWNSGKCPVCRAPIVDVVQVYAPLGSSLED